MKTKSQTEILAERHGRITELLRLLESGQITPAYSKMRRKEIMQELPLPWDKEAAE